MGVWRPEGAPTSDPWKTPDKERRLRSSAARPSPQGSRIPLAVGPQTRLYAPPPNLASGRSPTRSDSLRESRRLASRHTPWRGEAGAQLSSDSASSSRPSSVGQCSHRRKLARISAMGARLASDVTPGIDWSADWPAADVQLSADRLRRILVAPINPRSPTVVQHLQQHDEHDAHPCDSDNLHEPLDHGPPPGSIWRQALQPDQDQQAMGSIKPNRASRPRLGAQPRRPAS